MDFFEVIQQRHSVRSYSAAAVEPEKLAQILEAARLAPTACNLQEFRIVVLPTAGRTEELKKVYPAGWFTEAPLVLAVCVNPGQSWSRMDQKNYSDVDGAIVMDHIILAATALGLGTCWIGAFNPDVTRKALDLDQAWEPLALTPLGYAKDGAFKKTRKAVADLVIYQ